MATTEQHRILTLARRNADKIPKISNPARRVESVDFFKFLQNYFPKRAPEFTKNQIELVRFIEHSVRLGGQYAIGSPRGSGKSTLSRLAGLWAISYGIKKYVFFVCSNAEESNAALESITSAILSAPFVYDFPDVSFFIEKIIRSGSRLEPLFRGRLTGASVKNSKIVLPALPFSPASGGVFHCGSIFSRLRGKSVGTLSGFVNRPDFILIDDVQSESDSISPDQCKKIADTVDKTIVPMTFSVRNPTILQICTVINAGDYADSVLTSNEWDSLRLRTLREFPVHKTEWADLIWDYHHDKQDAKKKYLENRDFYDESADVDMKVYNKTRFPSALFQLMYEYNTNSRTFLAERQNEPASENRTNTPNGLSYEILLAASGFEPDEINYDAVGAGIDTHGDILYFVVMGKKDNAYYIIDCGVFPYQDYSIARSSMKAMDTVHPDTAHRTRNCLARLLDDLSRRRYGRKKIEKVFCDARWDSADVISAARKFKFASPLKGIAMSESQNPIWMWNSPYISMGSFWRFETDPHGSKRITVDSSLAKYYLSQQGLEEKILIASGIIRPTLCQHLSAETPSEVEGVYSVYKWRRVPNRENHFLDCAVYAFTALDFLLPAIKIKHTEAEVL
ncbi:hypothetical protein FACS189454_08620 [Planctomycetales bacterium]|nr:hypothetical protein FACS189454_08620 [Planctomycetales bacterium]